MGKGGKRGGGWGREWWMRRGIMELKRGARGKYSRERRRGWWMSGDDMGKGTGGREGVREGGGWWVGG